jgi:hypothetical protein
VIPAARSFRSERTVRVAGVIGIAGAAATVLGAALDCDRALASYLVAWCTCIVLAVGALAVSLIFYAANARWPAVVRRLLDAVTGAIAPLALLAVPLVLGAPRIWAWIDPSPSLAAEIAPRRAWLEPTGFTLRAVGYLAFWIVIAEIFRAWSRRRDAFPPGQAPLRRDDLDRERGAASALIAPVLLVLTFAAFDWLMSLDPTWSSSAFGLYVITGGLASGLSAVIVLAWRAQATGALPLRGPHFHALGRVLLAFVALWGYVAYFQAFLIQIADLPAEVTFYIARRSGAPHVVSYLLVALHLVLPFGLLLARGAKHRARYLAAVAVMLLVAHVLDMWWLVVPTLVPGAAPSWIDLSALAAVGGLAVAAAAWRVGGTTIVPVGDPYLETGLVYRSTT